MNEAPNPTPPTLTLRPASDCRWDLLSLGEVMLRFDPGEGRIVGARSFRVWEGGGEYNVARGLRRCFGLRTSIATALVDNPVGRLVEDLILQGGVDTSHIHWSPFDGVGRDARNGIYFLERGFGVRPGLGMMDRGHTAISQLKPGTIDWDAIFGTEGVRIFHTGGIMAALSEDATEVVREAITAARRHGTLVSYDGNYRASLWKSRGGRARSVEVNRSILPMVDVFFGHEGDVAATLGEDAHRPAWHTLDTFAPMAERVVAEYPNLKVLATTIRRPHTANRNSWSAFAFANHQASRRPRLRRPRHPRPRRRRRLLRLRPPLRPPRRQGSLAWSLNCGIAHGALAMTTPGDASMVTLPEVERLMSGSLPGTLR